LLEFTRKTNYKEYITQFDTKNKDVPKSELEDSLKGFIEQITNVDLYKRAMKSFRIDADFLPLGRLDKQLILEAQEILVEIK